MKPPESEPLATVRVNGVRDLPHLAWAEGMTFRWPCSLLSTAETSVCLGADLPRPKPMVAEQLRARAAFTDRPPVSSQLPFSYRQVPGWLRTWLASRVGRWQRSRQQRWAAFPAWPLDLSADMLEDWARARSSPWADRPTPVVLSHDLDSLEGLTNLVRSFLDMEELVGAHSTNFVVPCAWPLDHGLLQEVRQRGHELGIHGYDHSNRTAFLPAEQRAVRLRAGADLASRYSARGYRAPSLLRTLPLVNDLAHYYAYDSSIPTSGGLFPTPNNGCASARPFGLGGLIELPLSLPRDGSLLFLGYRPKEIVNLWLACAEQIHRSGGVVVLLTHCERHFSDQPVMRSAYQAFLEAVAGDRRFRFRTAWEVIRELTQVPGEESDAA